MEGGFMGDLPTQYASQEAAAGVGNAEACLMSIWPPPGDQELLCMPRSFRIGEERMGCVGRLPRGPTAGVRPPRALGLDVSLPLRHG